MAVLGAIITRIIVAGATIVFQGITAQVSVTIHIAVIGRIVVTRSTVVFIGLTAAFLGTVYNLNAAPLATAVLNTSHQTRGASHAGVAIIQLCRAPPFVVTILRTRF